MYVNFQDEVAHTLTENRVLQTTKHPFLTVSSSYSYTTMLFWATDGWSAGKKKV